jgi:hypothetical protein
VSYCANCGRLLNNNARFCTGCGTTVDASLPSRPAQIKKIIVLTPRRGGWLALKVFLVALVSDVVGAASLPRGSDKGMAQTWTALTFGIAAVYLIVRLRRWKQADEPVTGTVAVWLVAAFMAMMCLTGLVGASGTSSSSASTHLSTSNVAALSDTSSSTAYVKETLIRDAKLDFAWSKGGFDNIMMADFTVHNSTQYRFKDVEIKCTHFAPSGTEVDSNTRTIFEVFEPRSTKKIRQMNMGLIHSQVARSGCKITDLVVLQ